MILYCDPIYLEGSTVRLTMAFLHLLGYSNACVNPALYCFMNESFQRQLVRLLGHMCNSSSDGCKSRRSAATSAFSDEKSTLRSPAPRGVRAMRGVSAGDHQLAEIEATTQANGGTTLSLIVTTSSAH